MCLPRSPAAELSRLRGIPKWISHQVQPGPAAVDELVEVAGQALLEVIVFGSGANGSFDAERHGSHLPAVTLRAVVPALHRAHLPRTGIAHDGLPVRPLPFRTPWVR